MVILFTIPEHLSVSSTVGDESSWGGRSGGDTERRLGEPHAQTRRARGRWQHASRYDLRVLRDTQGQKAVFVIFFCFFFSNIFVDLSIYYLVCCKY